MTQNSIPSTIQDDEIIVRIIFSPYHLKKKKKLTPNAFRPPYNLDEVSVNRLNYTTPTFCKLLGKEMEGGLKEFYGIAAINYLEIIEAGAKIKASPILPENPFHADIYYGFICKKGEPFPAEINEITKKLAKVSRYYPDLDRQALEWTGSQLI